MNIDIILGKTTDHLVPFEGTKFSVHKLVVHDLRLLKAAGLEAGYDLQIVSSFRSFERQLAIWNAKARGERPLLDDQGRVLEHSELSPTELMYSILRWSTVPGSSRHHWGTDIDVYDANTQKLDEVQLIPSECEGNGPAANFHSWLSDQILRLKSHNFFRPYETDQGGVAPEKWHLSHAPIAQRIGQHFTHSIFRKNILESEILLKDELLKHSIEIFERFVLV
jgi:LAS superfamily LD-carboxypeptidase LdcB